MKKKIRQLQNFRVLKLLFLFCVTTCLLQTTTAQRTTTSSTQMNNVSAAISIQRVEVQNESLFGAVDGKILIYLNQNVSGNFEVGYDLHANNNRFKEEKLAQNGLIVLDKARNGEYYNLSVKRKSDNAVAIYSSSVVVLGKQRSMTNNDMSRSLCGSITFNNCAGSSMSVSGLYTESCYNLSSSSAPCGIEVGTSCAVVKTSTWKCIDGNLGAPAQYNYYVKTNYAGVGLTALQAARLNYIVCHYSINDASVPAAVWYISGTGGSNNAISQAAITAVPSPDGTENLVVFYKSQNASYQDMLEWECRTFTPGSLGDFVWNDLDADGLQDAGEPGISGVSVTLQRSNGTTVATTTTNASGAYNFSNLSPANDYIVIFSTPSGFTATLANQGADDTKDSDPALLGSVYNVSVTAGAHNSTVDAGFKTPCNAKVTGLYFNKLDGGADLPISNGAIFTQIQLNSLYNLEASTTGTVGSVVYSITGPTPSGNTENTAPYNSPGTGGGAWVGTNGSYSVNLKTYSGSDGTGSLCHDTTIHFTLNGTTAACNCPNNLIANPSFENGITSWSYDNTRGILSAGGGGVACGTYSGDLQITASGAWASQTFGTDLPAGTTINASVYAGTHDAAQNNYVAVVFFDANWNWMSQSVYVQVDKVLGNSPVGPQLYNITATVPVGAKYSQVSFGGDGSWTKTDQWCVTTTAPTTGSIGDRVWFDADGNGIQDASETTGIAGVTVQLRNSAGVVIATTTTNASGNYLFSGLFAGNYTVVFPVSISGAVVTGQNIGADDNIDSDANQSTGITPTISLGVGQNITNVDAGYCPTTLQLGDRVFEDTNNNGVRDATEVGIQGVVVNLYKDDNNDNIADGPSIATATTDVNGNYLFSNLAPGNYIVGATPPANYTSSTNAAIDPDNDFDTDDNGTNLVGAEWRGLAITLVAGTENNGTATNTDTNITYDFGFYQQAVINLGNYVWEDRNNNGTLDAGEPGVNGATVRLYRDANGDNVPDGAAIATTTTSSSGLYSFGSLIPGNYIVGVVIPTGYTSSATTATSANPNNDNDTDNNGVTTVSGELRSNFISLSTGGEPTADGDGNNGNLTLDFGIKGTGSIGDKVWNDLDGDGVQDAGEPGIQGVTVILTYAGGQTVTTTTDINGNYLFSNLAPGTYSVSFGTPSGAIFTASNVGDDALDSDPVGGVVGGINLTAGQNNLTIDAGFVYPQLNVGNYVWEDRNNNGTQDAGEPGVDGATVRLYRDANGDNVPDGAAIATTTTAGGGLYGFGSLIPGNYIVGVVIPTGYTSSVTTATSASPNNDNNTDNNGVTTVTGELRSNFISLSTGGEPTTDGDGNNGNLTLDFGIRGTGAIGNFVWEDLDGDGVQDAGEPGIQGVTVTLTYPGGSFVTTTTDANGNYLFPNLAPGATYIVTFGTPSGYSTSTSNAGGNDELDSDPVGGVVTNVVVTAGTTNNSIDAAFYRAVNVGNVVWYDQNNNGTKEPAELGVNGATVRLYADANNDNIADGAAIATTTTNSTGLYNFGNLAPGNYIVGVVIPAGYAVQTINGGDPDNNLDNDNNGTNTSVAGEVRSNAVTLTTTGEPTTDGDGNNGNLTVDFGLIGTGSIGNFVWEDVDGDGVQDAGEPGIQGVTVTLTYPNGQTVTTTTDANGAYNFPNLAPAPNYTVTFGTPSGLNPTGSNLGGNDETDSDPIGGVVSNVPVTAGVANNSVDAGFYRLLNLGNLVWYDIDNDGVKDTDEPGIGSATVRLYADANNDNIADGAAVATTTTDGNGNYTFTGLVAGNYIVGVVVPSGYTAQTINGGDPDNNTDNDNNGVTVVSGELRSNAVTLAPATEPTTDGDDNNGNLTVDFAFKGTASLGDFVWNDLNGNGIQDAGEPGIQGATVTLTYPNGKANTTTTNATGGYSFTDLAPGTYTVTFTTPAGTSPTTSNVTGGTATDANDSDPVGGIVSGIVLTAGQNNTTIDAGFVATNLNLGNFVWFDRNNNGTQDVGEFGVNGATVRLYRDNNGDNTPDGAAILTASTDVNGNYNFAGLTPGNYIVGVVLPTGYVSTVTTATSASPNNDNNTDNNGVTTVSGELRSNFVTLSTSGEPTTDGDGNNGNLTLDFGLVGTASIGDYVWNDVNGNGVQDITEVGIPNATVTLTFPGGQTVTTTTNGAGAYNFPNLPPGTYSVTFTTPAGLVSSPSNATGVGITDANDSDPIGGVVSGIVLTAGQNNNTIDAGFLACTVNSGINGPATICANEAALFTATAAGVGATYTWTFQSGTPATATGSSATSTWTTPGEYAITLVVTKDGCTATYNRTIVITQAVTAGAGPDAEICQGGSTTIPGTGPAGATFSWTVVSGDPTSIDNGANQANVLVSPLVTTTYQLTVSQNGCTRIDQVTVFVNVNRNPIANAGPIKTTCVNNALVIGGSPTGTPPLSQPTAPLGYIWSPATGLNDITIANPTLTLTTPGTYNYQVIVYNQLTGCSDTSVTQVVVEPNVNLGNVVWYDKNDDGIKQPTEAGIGTVTVKLYRDDNNDNVADGAAIATTTTNASGVYSFNNLCGGNYVVGVVTPNGYAPQTINSSDPNNNTDNDNNGVNTSVAGEVRSNAINVTVGEEPTVDGDGNNGNLTVDFGFRGTASIGDFVWYDGDRDGVQDGGATEPGIAGVVVTLTYPDGSTVSTTTSSTGAYNFTNLAPGTYSLSFATPVDMVATVSNSTNPDANDTNDSDPIGGAVTGIVLNPGQVNNTVDAGFHNPCTGTIRGNVWHDIDAMDDNQVDSLGASTVLPIPTGLRVSLVSNVTGKVIKSSLVTGLGTYTFTNVAPGSYFVVLSTTIGTIGQDPPSASLPQGWINTGEKFGTGPGRDLQINGLLTVIMNFECLINANFGIKLQNGDIGID